MTCGDVIVAGVQSMCKLINLLMQILLPRVGLGFLEQYFAGLSHLCHMSGVSVCKPT